MNKTKFSLLAVAIALSFLFTNVANAQDSPVTFGIKAGANYSTFGGNVMNAKSVFRYQVGVTADIALTENLYILTGLDLQTKGAKFKGEYAEKYNPMYIQLPVNIGYKFDLGSNIRLVVNAGPYVAYGIGGKVKADGHKESIFGKDKFKRLDYGLTGGAGVEFGKIVVSAGYDFGLANISDVKGTKVRNRNPFVTVGYKF